MCCMMDITTNSAPLMDEAVQAWSKDTYHPRGPMYALKDEGVTLAHSKGSQTAVFTLTGNGHNTSPESWVAAVKGIVTLYHWGLRLNPSKPTYQGRIKVADDAARWTLTHLGEPCDKRIVADNGLPVDLSLFCRGGSPMGLGKAESMVMDERVERHENDDDDECVCGCNDDCGEEPVARGRSN